MSHLMLASHNSWSYLKPTKWWMRSFLPFSKCQSKSIQWQLDNGVELFDLRIRFSPSGRLAVAHGLVEFDITEPELKSQLALLQGKSVRVLLERRQTDDIEVARFQSWVLWARELFPNIKFYGGHGAHGNIWHEKYVDLPAAPVIEHHASVSAHGVHKLYPFDYAKTTNGEVRTKWDNDSAYLMLDFVEY